MDTIPGLSSGKIAKLTCGSLITERLAPVAGSTRPEITGEKMIRPTELIRPP